MEIPNLLKVSRTFLTRCCLIQPIVRQLAKHAAPLALLWNRFCLFMDMVVTCGQHMAHVIQYNPFNNCRITIRLKTCECVRVSQRTNHARGAISWRCIPSKLLSLACLGSCLLRALMPLARLLAIHKVLGQDRRAFLEHLLGFVLTLQFFVCWRGVAAN